MAESIPTYSDLLDEAKRALKRILTGAKFVTVGGHQYHYSSSGELQKLIDYLEGKAAEESGTDGRGAWEAAFRE